jgi:signal transduction histidine kinase
LEIKKVSKEIAAGNFLSRIDNKKEDEIGELAEAINELGQELTKIEQLRKDLIANVSHELRTPLSLIQGYAETIRDISGDIPEKRQKQLGIIIEESQRLSAIVDDILKLSQLQSGYASLQKTVFSIIETVDSVITRYTGLCEQADIQIGFQSEKNAIVNADRARIEQVLHNLLFNAVNHTPAGGRISVTVVEEVNQVRIEISDTGKGIPEDEIPYIWDRYYKTEKNSGRQAGTGLGLAIVKTILEAHRVPYGIQSTMGEGSTFWFELESGFSL